MLVPSRSRAPIGAAAFDRLPPDASGILAVAHGLDGKIRLARGDREPALACFRTAVQTLSGISADREAAQLWFELGTLLAELGDVNAAMDAFRRSAASTGVTAPAQLGGVREHR